MRVVFIGADARIAVLAAQSCAMAWPASKLSVATTATDGLKLVEHGAPDLVLLHPDFSDLSLSAAITWLRRFSNIPLLVLGQSGDEMEVVTALELGADEYVRLPCPMAELIVRLRALLRRSGIGMSLKSEDPFISGPLLINPATYEVFINGQPLALTYREFQLLHLLAKNQGRVVSRQHLEQAIWGEAVDGSGGLSTYIRRLRQKLGAPAWKPCWIASVKGIGYRFIGPASDAAAPAAR
jgi:two-component system, OmpR family, alkaline phosphatase synthesis response regulator PhoP